MGSTHRVAKALSCRYTVVRSSDGAALGYYESRERAEQLATALAPVAVEIVEGLVPERERPAPADDDEEERTPPLFLSDGLEAPAPRRRAPEAETHKSRLEQLHDQGIQSLEEVAWALGCSHTEVRRIEQRALHKLRRALAAQGISKEVVVA